MFQQGDRRQATSGSRAGESFWTEEKENFGMKMMQQMGWEAGKGLGKKEDGTKQYLKAKYKADSKGIGATGNQEDATWTATQDLYTEALKNLKTANSSPSPSPSPMEESVEVTESTTTSSSVDGATNTTTTIKNLIAKRTLYGRFKRSKDTASYSATAMSEIFGRKPSDPAPVKQLQSESTEPKIKVKQEHQDHELLQTSKMSIRDYFAQKLAAAGKLGGVSAQEFASGGITKPEPVVKEEEVEQPRGFTMSQQEDYYNRMMNCAIGGEGVRTGQRAKVGLGFGGAGTGGNITPSAGMGRQTSSLIHAKKSIKLEDTAFMADSSLKDPAPSPVASYEEETVDAAAVDAVPHGTVGHDDEEAKARRKAEKKEKKAAKKRKREEDEAAAAAEAAEAERKAKKAAKKAKKESKKKKKQESDSD